jgi:acetyl-CoA acetyltransferase
MVSVVQREWAAKNPRATFKTPITVEDVLNSRMIAYPFRLLQRCLVTDGGGALILVSAERARDFPQKPVYLIGTGESVETPIVSQMADFTCSRAFRVAGAKALAEAGITHNDVDRLMIYDAFAHLPIYGLEDLGFVPRGEAGAFIAERNTAPGGKLPLNTSVVHALRHVRHVRAAGERAPNARHRPRPNPRCQDLGLPRRRRQVRRLRRHHHVE